MKDMAMKKKEEYEYHDNDDVNDKTKIDIDSLRITLSVWIFWSRSRSSCFSTPENHIPFFGERTIYITAIGHCLESTRTRRIWAYQIEISAWDWLSWPGSEVFDIITMCRLGKPRDQLSLVTPSKVLPWAVRRVSFHKKVPWRRGNLFSIDLFTFEKLQFLRGTDHLMFWLDLRGFGDHHHLRLGLLNLNQTAASRSPQKVIYDGSPHEASLLLTWDCIFQSINWMPLPVRECPLNLVWRFSTPWIVEVKTLNLPGSQPQRQHCLSSQRFTVCSSSESLPSSASVVFTERIRTCIKLRRFGRDGEVREGQFRPLESMTLWNLFCFLKRWVNSRRASLGRSTSTRHCIYFHRDIGSSYIKYYEMIEYIIEGSLEV